MLLPAEWFGEGRGGSFIDFGTNIKTKVAKQMHEKKKDKVAIVGMAPRSRDDAPFRDKDFEIWVSNEMYGYVPRFDVLFEVHDWKEFQAKKRNSKHYDWMKWNVTFPIYMSAEFKEIPMSTLYPYQEIIANYGMYIVSTVVLQFLLALHMGYDEIHVYGCSLSTKEEQYSLQKACFEHHLGYAMGLRKATGKPVIYIPKNCELLKCDHIYGKDGVDQLPYILINAKQAAEKRQKEKDIEVVEGIRKVSYQQGRIDAIEELQHLVTK